MRELLPIPGPSGGLQPPRRYPPTAAGIENPEPEPEPRLRTRFGGMWASRPSVLGDVLHFAFAPARAAFRAWRSLRRAGGR